MRIVRYGGNLILLGFLCLACAGGSVRAAVNYEIWDVDLDVLPDYATLGAPDASGLISNFDIETLRGDTDYFTFRFTGYIRIDTPGTYTFYTASDDGSKLYIGDWEGVGPLTEVVNNDGTHGTQEQSGTIELSAGYHGIMVTFFEKGGGDVLEVRWEGPGIAKDFIPDEVLFDAFARDKSPANGAVNLPVDTILQWAAPDPALQADPTFVVFFGTEPNLPLMTKVVEAQGVTQYDPELDFGTQYYWSVGLLDPNEGGNPTLIAGPVTGFQTAPKSPVILTQPAKTAVWPGETATFSVEVLSAAGAPVSYAWYKQGSGDVLSTTDTLVIADAQLEDEGLYYCVATNEFGSDTSDTAELHIKKLVGHWPFDGDFEDKVGGNDGTPVGQEITFAEGIIGQAAEFLGLDGEPSQAVYMSTSALEPGQSWTLSFWEYTADAVRAGYMLASGSPNGYEQLYMWRRENDVYYGNLNMTQAGGNIGTIGQLPGTYPVQQWHLNTMTYDADANIYTWYVDGVARASATPPTDTVVFDERFYVANRRNLARAYRGLIDDFRVYDFAMDDIEVATLYTDTVGGYVCLETVPNDLNGDCIVNLLDLALMTASWTDCNLLPVGACD